MSCQILQAFYDDIYIYLSFLSFIIIIYMLKVHIYSIYGDLTT